MTSLADEVAGRSAPVRLGTGTIRTIPWVDMYAYTPFPC